MRYFATAGLTALLLIASANAWITFSTRARAYGSVGSLPPCEVAIVPGSPTSQGRARAILERRLEGALALYRANRVSAILVSGSENHSNPETSVMTAWLVERGVPSDRILIDPRGLRTRDTMVRAMKIFDVTRAIICTEGLHMPRSLFLARDSGIDAFGFELPSPLSHSPRRVAVESLKNALAIFEAIL